MYCMNRRDIQSKGYPTNIMTDMGFDEETINSVIQDKEKVGSLEYVMKSTLTERNYEMVKDYWERYYSMKDISKKLDLTTERVREIISSSSSKIKLGKRYNMITKGLNAYYRDLMKSRIDTLEYLESEENKKKKEIEDDKNAKMDRIKCRLSDSIDILNLSVRAKNALMRDKRDEIWTLYIASYEEILDIRNLGIKSARELINSLEEICGITVLHDRQRDELDNRKQICKDLNLVAHVTNSYNRFYTPRWVRDWGEEDAL